MGDSSQQHKYAEWNPELALQCCTFHGDTFAHEFTVREVFHAYAEVSVTMGERNEEAL
jgi:hypothetical protein